MQSDGDIWGEFWEILEARGARTVRITKVKGHATEEDVQDGRATKEDKEGNDQADAAANKGARSMQEGFVIFAQWAKGRVQAYTNLMQRIQKVISAVLKAEKAKREEEEKDRGGGKEHLKMKDRPVKMSNTLTQADWESSEKLLFAPPPRMNHIFAERRAKL